MVSNFATCSSNGATGCLKVVASKRAFENELQLEALRERKGKIWIVCRGRLERWKPSQVVAQVVGKNCCKTAAMNREEGDAKLEGKVHHVVFRETHPEQLRAENLRTKQKHNQHHTLGHTADQIRSMDTEADKL